jgi:hypothetical protein
MKINRHGKAKILTPHEVTQLFEVGLTNSRIELCLGSASTRDAGLPKLAHLELMISMDLVVCDRS